MTTSTVSGHATPTTHSAIIDWVDEVAAFTTPDEGVWCDGSDDEWRRLTKLLVSNGTFGWLSRQPKSFWCASDPEDVARVEDRSFICSRQPAGGPTNNWMDPVDMKTVMTEIQSIDQWYTRIGGDRLPEGLRQHLADLKLRVSAG